MALGGHSCVQQMVAKLQHRAYSSSVKTNLTQSWTAVPRENKPRIFFSRPMKIRHKNKSEMLENAHKGIREFHFMLGLIWNLFLPLIIPQIPSGWKQPKIYWEYAFEIFNLMQKSDSKIYVLVFFFYFGDPTWFLELDSTSLNNKVGVIKNSWCLVRVETFSVDIFYFRQKSLNILMDRIGSSWIGLEVPKQFPFLWGWNFGGVLEKEPIKINEIKLKCLVSSLKET